MGQIVKRKKKGRPAKADPGARDPPQTDRDLRRSHRRRSVKYVFDLDDYFDEDEVFVDDEDQRRREKKLKHLLKLQGGAEPDSTSPRDRRVQHAPAESSSSSDDGGKPSKKRKIDEEMDEDVDEENDDANEEENYNDEDEEEVGDAKQELKAEDSPPGTPAATRCGLRLPDKKVLELILDKLQRKDVYGVYAEPVDPEELPDYHDVIQHPMDFATVRNKLRNGLYAAFDQFESDIFLICSNAMQYNAPDTVYYKQARTIQELAKRKFLKIKLTFERHDKETKSEQKTRSGSISRKQTKRPVSRTAQEPVGSDFSSGATLATVGDFQNVASALQAVGSEKTGGLDGLVDGSSILNDNNLDKAEDSLLGRSPQLRFGRRSSFIQDEDRRATYNISLSQPVASSESIFSTFDEETKLLMPVGLYSDHSYARSLARFAATLGSVAWQVASKRIEQALPQGFKFGQGWVGEYEPLPTPVLMLENCSVKEPPFFTKVQPASTPRNFERVPIISYTSKESQGNLPFFEQKLPFLGPAGFRSPVPINTAQPIRGNMSETKPSFFLSPGIRPSGSHNLSYINQNLQSRDFLETDKKVHKQVELNSPRTLNKIAADSVGNRPFSRSSKSDVEASRSVDLSSKNINLSQSGSFKQPDHSNGVAFGGMPNGKVVSNRADGNTVPSSPADLKKPANYYPHEQGQQTKPASYYSHEQGQQTKPASYYTHEQGQQVRQGGYNPHEQSQQMKPGGYCPHEHSQKTKPGGYYPHEQGQQTKPGAYYPHEQSQQTNPSGYYPHEQSQQTKPGGYNPHEQSQGLSDPVQMMRMMADQNQQKSSNPSPADPPQVLSPAPSLSSNDPNTAAMAAARAWMSVGAGGLRPLTENANQSKNHMYGEPVYNHSQNIQSQGLQIRGEFPSSGMHVRPDKNSAPMHAFVQQGAIPMLVGNQIQFQNQRMVFPQLAPADLSRFQLQSSWRNVSPQMHSRQKQESLPPDLNIGFQSSGSPGRPSSGVMVDSQQPDLALQL